MMQFKHSLPRSKKNDFSVTFYNREDKIMFFRYCHNFSSAAQWMMKKNKIWTHAMVYNRRTRESLERIINELEYWKYFEK